MKVMSKLLSILVLGLLFKGCTKETKQEQVYENCNNAVLSIKNLTGDTVHYSWGANYFDKVVLPGATASYSCGPIHNNANNTGSYWVGFNSAERGSADYLVTKCNKNYDLH